MSVETSEDILNKVVSHRARRADFFDLERDGIGLVDANPDGQNGVASRIFKDHDGGVGDWIHQQTANFHFNFHRVTSAAKTAIQQVVRHPLWRLFVELSVLCGRVWKSSTTESTELHRAKIIEEYLTTSPSRQPNYSGTL